MEASLALGDLDDKEDQLFRLLSSLTTHESEDLVINTKNGFEAWRRLNRRWDPWDSVRPAIEQLDDLMRRYEARRNEQGNREIKCTSLELLVPADIERHLFLNKSRLTTYQDMRQEIEVLIWSQAKFTDPGPARHRVPDKAQLLWTSTPSRRFSTLWSKEARKEAKAREMIKVVTKARGKVRTAKAKEKAVDPVSLELPVLASTVERPATRRPSVGVWPGHPQPFAILMVPQALLQKRAVQNLQVCRRFCKNWPGYGAAMSCLASLVDA